MQDSTSTTTHSNSILDKLSTYIIVGLAFLIPVFFVPSASFPFQFSKTFLVLVVIVVLWLLFSLQTLQRGTVSFTWSRLIPALLLVPIAYLIASIFSSVPTVSFFGYQLDQDTFGFVALATMLTIVTTLVVKKEKQIFSVLFGFLIAGWTVLIFQSIQLFFKNPILPTLFTSPTVNIVGSWSDFALFIALLASLILLAMEALTLSVLSLIVLSATLILALFVLAIANFSLAWLILGGVAFVMLVLTFTRNRTKVSGSTFRASGVAACLTLAVAVFFVFFGLKLGNDLQNYYHIQALEVRPSIQGTLGILEHVYEKNAFLGSGPNSFSQTWLVARSPQVLSTPFWNVDFSAGFGSIPTSFITGGIVVGLAWLIFILWFLYTATRALFTVPIGEDRSYFLIAATALGSLFLILAHIFYVPNAGLSLLLFLFIGLFIASLRGTTFARPVNIVFSESPRLGFLSVLLVAVTLVLSLVSLYSAGEMYASAVQEGKAIVLSNAGDMAGATAAITKAASLSPQDRYYRTLTVLALAHLNTIVQKGGSDKATQDAFQAGLSDAIVASTAAIGANPFRFDNWMSRASVYEAVVPLKIDGAYDKAVATLEEARKYNPNSPEVDYHLANLMAFQNDTAGARTSALSALAKKADYTPAILLLAQLSLNEGKIDDAIASVNSAIVFNPQDSSLKYQLGLLELSAKKYEEAGASFAAALAITPDFANASFFLGQADVFLGKSDEALALFKSLQEKNPDNANLQAVINALEKGENPFEKGTVTPTEKTPASV